MDDNGGSTHPAVDAVGTDVAAVLDREPFALAAPLAALRRDDLVAMTAAESEVVIAATQRLTNALAAVQTAAVTSFADEVDRDLDVYREQRRRDVEARRDDAEARGVPFGERWFPIPGEEQFAAAALAPLLHVSPRAMSSRINRARRIDHEMPGTWASARSGDLEPYRSDAIVRASEPLPEEHLEEFEAHLFADDVMRLAVADLTRRARRAAVATDQASVEEVAARARRKRAVSCGPHRDLPGLTSWRLLLPAETSRQMWAAVDELAQEYHRARRDAGDPVTMDQARADAFADLVLARATVETTVELVVPVAAMMGEEGHSGPGLYRWGQHLSPAEVLQRDRDDDLTLHWVNGVDLHRASVYEAELCLHLTRDLEIRGNPHLSHAPPRAHRRPLGTPRGPGAPRGPAPGDPSGPAAHVAAWFVPGHVDAARVGALLPDDLTALLDDPATRIRVVGSDPGTGTISTDSTDAYRPGRSVARRVRRRDGTCRFPGCTASAERAQLDHVTPYPHGRTEVTNLVCLCTTHHGFKHHAGWRLTMTPEGACTWTAPTGRTHTTLPRQVHSTSV